MDPEEREDRRRSKGQLMNFTNKMVVVAGGTGALGRAVALQFLEAGATVTVTYRKQAEYDALAAAAGGYAARLSGQVLDVTDESSTKQFVDSFVERHGHLDVLVNSVGGYAGGPVSYTHLTLPTICSV